MTTTERAEVEDFRATLAAVTELLFPDNDDDPLDDDQEVEAAILATEALTKLAARDGPGLAGAVAGEVLKVFQAAVRARRSPLWAGVPS